MMSRMRKYKLATRRNCSRRLRGRKVMMLYLDVVTTLFCKQKKEKRNSSQAVAMIHIKSA